MRNVENSAKPRVNNDSITKRILTEFFIGKDLKILGSYTLQPGSTYFLLSS